MRQFLGFCLYKFALSIRGRFESKIEIHGLLAPQCAILKLLDSEGTMTQRELGSYLAIDKASAVRLIDGLEENGYVTRTEDANDRRAKQLAITNKGHATLEKVSSARLAAESEALSPLSEAERKQFRELVAKLTLE
jgi:DNA-binding MarR family transcriptional regulator